MNRGKEGGEMDFKQGNGTVAAVSYTASDFVGYVLLEVLSAAQSCE
jgi:hypothetical protein